MLAVLLSDSFEQSEWSGNWVEDSQNDWFRSTQRATDGGYAAEVDGRATDATLTLATSIDLTAYSSPELTFDWLIESGFDRNEYLSLDVSTDGGANWQQDVRQLSGNVDAENTWHSESVDLSPFSSSNLLVRFRSKVSRSNEDANVDNVKITGLSDGPEFPPPTISFADFSDASELNLIGHSGTTLDDRLRLTSAESGQVGAAWYEEKQYVSVSFETTFQFQLTEGSQGADGGSDGFAFVIQNFSDDILGPGGGHLGYHQISNSVAVEFDTYQNSTEPSDSHVSVQTRGMLRNRSEHTFSLSSFSTSGFKLDHGNLHTAKIAYTPGTLSVYLDNLASPALSVPLDLESTLDLDLGRAYVGFTAANGGGWENHDILNWQFGNLVDTATTIGIADVSELEGDTAAAVAEFQISRLGDLSDVATLDWSTSPGSASAGVDYTPSSGQIVFAPGESSKAVQVPIAGDTSEEEHETFFVNLSLAGGGATLVDPQGKGTILNDETSVTVSDATVTEGSNSFRFIDAFIEPESGGLRGGRGIAYGPDGNLYINSNMPSAIVRFDANTGAFIDRFAEHPGSQHASYKHVTFGPDGNLYASDNHSNQVVRFDGVTGDFIDIFVAENSGGLETVRSLQFGPDNNLYLASASTDEILRYQGPFGTTPGAFINAFVSSGRGGLDSPSGQTFGPDGALYVASLATDSVLKYDGTTGQFLGDFVSSANGGLDRPTTGGLLFGPDRTNDGFQDLFVSSSGEPDSVSLFDGVTGNFVETIVPEGLGGLSYPTGLLFDTDDNLLVYDNDSDSVLRYGSDSQAVFSVTLSKPSAVPVTLQFATVDGTATAAYGDYHAASKTVTFAPGVTTQTIPVRTFDDSAAEGDETFLVTLSNATGATILDNEGTGTINDNEVANLPPNADAGSDKTVIDSDGSGDEVVTLSGSGSMDMDGTIVTYEWKNGTEVVGSSEIVSANLSLGTHAFTLTVTDNAGATGSDTVDVTVGANQAPSADAGADQSAADADGSGDQVVTLTGSGTDSDGSITSFQWSEGSTILGNTATMSRSLDVGTHTLTFTVTDNGGATASDTVVVTVVANQSPTADAGTDLVVTDNDGSGNEVVTLNGSGTDSDGLIVSYEWSDGTNVLGNTASISPSLSVGTHTLTLTVTDDGGLASSDSVSVTVDEAAAGPNLSHGQISSVGGTWHTVTLGSSYTSMVVVATPRYDSGSGPGVVRLRNVSSNSFDVRVDNLGSTPFNGGMHYIAVEEGVYDEPGRYKLEAVKYTESQTSRKSGWVIDTASLGYQQPYDNPVVVGQVMSANDADWSVFWASSGSRTSPPSSSALNVGKHIAEDTNTSRAAETIGYLVIESTQNGSIEGLPFVAGVGDDTVRGVGNGTYQYDYDAMPNAKTAILASAGMDGGDGGWPVLRGTNPLPASSGTISLSIDEDQLRDSERNHTTEQVAYFVIDPPLQQAWTPTSVSMDISSLLVGVDQVYPEITITHSTDGRRVQVQKLVAPQDPATPQTPTVERVKVPPIAARRPATELQALDQHFSDRIFLESFFDDELLDELI